MFTPSSIFIGCEHISVVIATQRVAPTGRANARPMTGSVKQARATREDWIASSLTLLANDD
jgi:hypothetical protein